MKPPQQYVTLACPQCGRQKDVRAHPASHRLDCCAIYVATISPGPGHWMTKNLVTKYRRVKAEAIPNRAEGHEFKWCAFMDGVEATGYGPDRAGAISDLMHTLGVS